MTRLCIRGCGHPVGGGGNCHALGSCPAPRNPKGNRRARLRGERRRWRREGEALSSSSFTMPYRAPVEHAE